MTRNRTRKGGPALTPEGRAAQLANLVPIGPPPVGNQRALKHGGAARIARDRLAARAADIFDALAESAPLRDGVDGLPVHDRAVVALLAECLCRLENVSSWLNENGLIDGKGNVRPAAELERRLRTEAAGYMRDLGMTPLARARLGLDLQRTLTAGERLDAHLREHYGGGSA